MPWSGKEWRAPKADLWRLWGWTDRRWDFWSTVPSPSHLACSPALPRGCQAMPCWQPHFLLQQQENWKFSFCSSPLLPMQDLLPPQLSWCGFICKLSKLDQWSVCPSKKPLLKKVYFCLNKKYLQSITSCSTDTWMPPLHKREKGDNMNPWAQAPWGAESCSCSRPWHRDCWEQGGAQWESPEAQA